MLHSLDHFMFIEHTGIGGAAGGGQQSSNKVLKCYEWNNNVTAVAKKTKEINLLVGNESGLDFLLPIEVQSFFRLCTRARMKVMTSTICTMHFFSFPFKIYTIGKFSVNFFLGEQRFSLTFPQCHRLSVIQVNEDSIITQGFACLLNLWQTAAASRFFYSDCRNEKAAVIYKPYVTHKPSTRTCKAKCTVVTNPEEKGTFIPPTFTNLRT